MPTANPCSDACRASRVAFDPVLPTIRSLSAGRTGGGGRGVTRARGDHRGLRPHPSSPTPALTPEAVDRVRDEHDVLVPRHELPLAGGAANDEAVDARGDLDRDQGVVRGQVDLAICAVGRLDGGDESGRRGGGGKGGGWVARAGGRRANCGPRPRPHPHPGPRMVCAVASAGLRRGQRSNACGGPRARRPRRPPTPNRSSLLLSLGLAHRVRARVARGGRRGGRGEHGGRGAAGRARHARPGVRGNAAHGGKRRRGGPAGRQAGRGSV